MACFDELFRRSCPSLVPSQLLAQWCEECPKSIVYMLDGARMKAVDDYESELMRVFKLPDYYGKNLNALYECLTDEGVLGEGDEAILVVVFNADQVLSLESDDAREGFFDTLRLAAMDWRVERPMYSGGPDRATRPFHVVLVGHES